jgi:hypothetical protein
MSKPRAEGREAAESRERRPESREQGDSFFLGERAEVRVQFAHNARLQISAEKHATDDLDIQPDS